MNFSGSNVSAGQSSINSHHETTKERPNINCKLIAFLRDEISLLIESQTDTEVSFIRLHRLLERMRYHFGPDPKNPCFTRFLRLALKNMNYKACLLLICKGYVHIDSLIVDTNDVPDYLFLLFFYARNGSEKQQQTRQLDSENMINLVQRLIPLTHVNAYYEFYGLSLIDLLVDCIASEVLTSGCQKSCSSLSVCAEITLDMIMSHPDFDLKSVIRSCPLEKNPIQRAINDHKFLVANKLLQKVRRSMNINAIIKIDSIAIFTELTSTLFKTMYLSGFKFDVGFAESLKEQIILCSDEMTEFLSWLKCMQSRVSPLSLQAWNCLKNHSDENILQEVTEAFLLPDELTM